MSNKHLLIISIDALNMKDLNYIKNLDTFKAFIENGSYVEEVESIYPSLTYPCHTSIITGNYPNRHGIYQNEKCEPEYSLNQDWNWFKKDIKSPTLFDIATNSGLDCATFLWPVMAGPKGSIKYDLPEIWGNRRGNILKMYMQYGTKNILPYVLRHNNKLKGTTQPYLDNFTTAISSDIIVKKKPNITAIHLIELDSARHEYGMWSKEAYIALDRIEKRIQKIINATKKAGIYDDTNFVLLGDHGGNNFNQAICINSIFAKKGLIKTKELNLKNLGTLSQKIAKKIDQIGSKKLDTKLDYSDFMEISSWQAYANSAGGSCHIHLKDPSDTILYNKVKNILHKLSIMPGTPISRFYTRETAKKFHLFGDYSFILEAKDGYTFRNMICKDLIIDSSKTPHKYKADHGFLPSHPNLKTLLFMKGPAIKSGVCIPKSKIIDEGPTMAALLGLTLPDTDGKILNELLL